VTFPEMQPNRSRLAEASRQCPLCGTEMKVADFQAHELYEQVWVDWKCLNCGKVLKLRYSNDVTYKFIEVTERKVGR
jgi:uncharacterized Zn finger protein